MFYNEKEQVILGGFLMERKIKKSVVATGLAATTIISGSLSHPVNAEEAKPKTEAERLELTRKKAMEKLDFYERVVRSVAREEAEVAGYYEIMGEEKARPSIMDEQKAEVTEQTSPAEVPQEAAPVEVQQ